MWNLTKRKLRGFATKLLHKFSSFIYNSFYKSYRLIQFQSFKREETGKLHNKGSYLLGIWHEHLLSVSMAQKGHPFRPLASKSFSGRLMGYVLENFGYTPVYGSQKRGNRDKGGKAAREELIRVCSLGFPSAYTVDGSTGPRRVVKPGIVDIARKSGAAILPAAAAASRYWTAPSWDQLKIPKPFSKVVVAYGDPIKVPEDISREDFETYVRLVKDGINKAEQIALEELHRLQGHGKKSPNFGCRQKPIESK